MNIKKLINIIILIVILTSLASAKLENNKVEDYNDYVSLNLLTVVEASILPKPNLDKIRLKSLNANLSFIPLSTESQFIQDLKINSEPKANVEEHGNYILLTWTELAEKYKYILNAKVKTMLWFPKVYRITKFPYDFNEPELISYIQPTEMIDINSDIRNITTFIIQGQTDYYKVVHKIAEWVENNVEYNLTTLNEKSVFKASRVLQTKEGVCDEITNLFIAMLRSIGIPARFVTGQVYSNIGYDFGNHGWAEVYFPEIGWVPFDVTFKQLGWADATHIKFSELVDPSVPSVTYNWVGNNVEMYVNPLLVRTNIESVQGSAEKYAELSIASLKNKVGPGSYVPIKVTVKNTQNFYLPLLIRLTKSTEIIGNNYKNVLLEPFEEKNLFWIIKMPDNIKSGYIYTATIETDSSSSSPNATKIKISNNYPVYEKEWATERVKRLKPREIKSYLPNIDLSCHLNKPYYYRNEQAILACSLKNKGNTNFNLIKFCLETDCHDLELKIGESKNYEWNINVKDVKYPELRVSAESKNLIKYTYPTIKIIEKPKIVVHDFQPMQVKYNTDSNFQFLLSSDVPAYNVTLRIKNYGSTNLGTLNEKQVYLMPFNSKDFRHGKVEVTLTYNDEIGKQYSQEQVFKVDVTDLPWLIKFLVWIEKYLS